MVDRLISTAWKHEAGLEVKERLAELDHEAMESGDPCLAECCRRDVMDQIYSSKRDAFLAGHDPTRQHAAARTLQAPPSPAAGAAADAELEALRADRLRQMRRGAGGRANAAAEGHGTLRDLDQPAALDVMDNCAAAVLHLHQPSSSGATDEMLSQLSARFFGTRFVRAPAASCPDVLARCRLSEGAWLVAVRGGRVVGARPATPEPEDEEALDGEGDDRDSLLSQEPTWEEQTEEWLGCLEVLHRDLPKEGSGGSVRDADEPPADGATPCPTCGRTYFHVHKAAVRQSLLADGYEEDGF